MPRYMVIEDDVPLGEGITRRLGEVGLDALAPAVDPDALLRQGLAHRPDVVIADINRAPEGHEDGLNAHGPPDAEELLWLVRLPRLRFSGFFPMTTGRLAGTIRRVWT